MHEAGLALAIADALHAGGVDRGHARVRLRVRGGHSRSEDFDGALRLHLQAAAPDIATDIEIVHEPVDQLCVGCLETFAAVSPEEPCPRCGGSALPMPVPERIDIELVRPGSPISAPIDAAKGAFLARAVDVDNVVEAVGFVNEHGPGNDGGRVHGQAAVAAARPPAERR